METSYLVIANCWDEETKQTLKYIVGEFDEFLNAYTFAIACEWLYNARPEIITIK